MEAIEKRVCDIAADFLSLPRKQVQPASRVIEDLNCDSLGLAELIMTLEEEFGVTFPNQPDHPVGKSIFTRRSIRLRDLAEIIYVVQGTGASTRTDWRKRKVEAPQEASTLFTQLGGRWQKDADREHRNFFEPLEFEKTSREFRRVSDGMRCILIPAGQATLGSDKSDDQPDEHPAHLVEIDAFLMDAEPVSTTAFCRFLNSVPGTPANLFDWFQLAPGDDRVAQMPIHISEKGWRPITGTETLPMILVSWFGANAYSLWAHGATWDQYAIRDGFLPTEAQWEYAARGAYREPSQQEAIGKRFVHGQHEPRTQYRADNLPMAPVHYPLGVSDFGLHHMAGNVWQWCRDWYAEDFYQRPESRQNNPVNTVETGVRSERGGSWVGPRELCRTTYRRGRVPIARGRCLGFRCVSPVEWLGEKSRG